MSSAAVISSELEELQKGVTRTRIVKDVWWIYFTIFYVPIGVLLLVIRVCISIQAFLMLTLLPNAFPLKRIMLRVIFSTLGIVVLLDDEHRDTSVKVLVANKVSLIDHLLFHLVTSCISIYPQLDHPFIYSLPHHTLVAKDDETWQREASKITVGCQVVTQPEGMATNGLHLLLKYRAWPFVLDELVQPVIIKAFRPVNVAGLNISSVSNTSALMDLLSCFYSPVTIFRIGYLPVVRQGADETVQQFADRTQQAVGRALNLVCTKLDSSDVQRWNRSSNLTSSPVVTGVASNDDDIDNSVPYIPISQFNKMMPQGDAQLETMVRQVSDVLPQVPDHAIQEDLMHTRDVDKTITNLLEGRVHYDPAPPQGSTIPTNTPRSSLKHLSFSERKIAFIEEARRRYICKHGQ